LNYFKFSFIIDASVIISENFLQAKTCLEDYLSVNSALFRLCEINYISILHSKCSVNELFD